MKTTQICASKTLRLLCTGLGGWGRRPRAPLNEGLRVTAGPAAWPWLLGGALLAPPVPLPAAPFSGCPPVSVSLSLCRLLPSSSVFPPVCECLLRSLPSRWAINQPGLLSPIILRTLAFEISADGLGPRPVPRAAQATQPAGGSTRGGCQARCPVPICADARPLPGRRSPRRAKQFRPWLGSVPVGGGSVCH